MGFLLAGEINLDLCVGRTTGSRPKTVGYFKTYPWRAGCGFGSGSTIWEKLKRKEARLKTIDQRTIRLHLRHPPVN